MKIWIRPVTAVNSAAGNKGKTLWQPGETADTRKETPMGLLRVSSLVGSIQLHVFRMLETPALGFWEIKEENTPRICESGGGRSLNVGEHGYRLRYGNGYEYGE